MTSRPVGETIVKAFDRNGFCVLPGVLDAECRHGLQDALAQSNTAQARRGSAVYGARNLLAHRSIRDLAESPAVRAIVDALAGPSARVVRGLFFDKTAEANWHVPWHQDLVLAVGERVEIAGWGPWTVKAGVPHVEAPPARLARMVTLRLHLDDCGADNGPVRVLPGTHARGRLRNADIKRVRDEVPAQVCLAEVGAALVMRPLLVHASSAAKTPGHRRVLHLEFAPDDLLPPPLEWAH